MNYPLFYNKRNRLQNESKSVKLGVKKAILKGFNTNSPE